MKSGVAGLELEVTLAFHDDGTPSGMRSIAAEGIALPEHISGPLWRYLSSLKPADAVVEAALDDAERKAKADAAAGVSRVAARVAEQAWESADDEADDVGADEEREAS